MNTWPTHWIEAARRAGLLSGADATTGQMFIVNGLRAELAAFAQAVEAAERERCAKLVEDRQQQAPDDGLNGWMLAAEIRGAGK